MSTLAERLVLLFKENPELSQAGLARACEIAQPSVNDWFSGRTKRMTGKNLLRAAVYLNVNPEWLATGKGEMRSSKIIKFDNNVEPFPLVGARKIPVISYVQAGRMAEAVDQYEIGGSDKFLLTHLELSANAFALIIKGNSMLPEFKEGDTVIIDPAVQPRPGEFVVAKNHENEATFKKYRPRGLNEKGEQVFELVPLNEDYPSMRSDITKIVIIGTAVEHIRALR